MGHPPGRGLRPHFVVALATATSVTQAQVAMPAAVKAALVSNARQLTPLRVRLTDQYASNLPVETLAGRLNMTETVTRRLLRYRVKTIGRDGVAFYSRVDEQVGDAWETREAAFDGMILYTGDRTSTIQDQLRPELTRRAVAQMDPKKPVWVDEYLILAGYDVPNTAGALASHEPVQSILLALSNDGRAVKAIRNAESDKGQLLEFDIDVPNPLKAGIRNVDPKAAEAELRSTPGQTEEWVERQVALLHETIALPDTITATFTLDPSYNYALVARNNHYPDGQVIDAMAATDFERLGDRDVWVPRRQDMDYFIYRTAPTAAAESPILHRQQRVQGHIELSPLPAQTFVLVYKTPGTLVVDQTRGVTSLITVNATRRASESAGEPAATEAQEGPARSNVRQQSPSPKDNVDAPTEHKKSVLMAIGSRLLYWTAGVGFIAVGAVVLLALTLRRRTAARPQRSQRRPTPGSAS